MGVKNLTHCDVFSLQAQDKGAISTSYMRDLTVYQALMWPRSSCMQVEQGLSPAVGRELSLGLPVKVRGCYDSAGQGRGG